MLPNTQATLIHTNVVTDTKLIGKVCVVDFSFDLDTPTPFAWVRFGRSRRCVPLRWLKGVSV